MEPNYITVTLCIGNESVPIQQAQCWFPGLAISMDVLAPFVSVLRHSDCVFHVLMLSILACVHPAPGSVPCVISFSRLSLMCRNCMKW